MRLFGTNGIREVVGERLDAPLVTAVASAIACCVPTAAPIVVGWDGRTSSPAIARIVTATLALAGHHVIELGVLPTPAIQYNIRSLGAQLGVVVTASHNPPEFNGVKLIAADGLEVPRETELAVERDVAAHRGQAVPFDKVGSIEADGRGVQRYLQGILKQVDPSKISERHFRVVLDCGNGASVVTSPALLRHLGCRVITINGHLDGTFPGRRSEPTETNVADLLKTVPAVGADFGVAHDGDADRAVFVDAKGHYIPGERMLALVAREAVRRHGGGTVVTPVTASQAVEDAVKSVGGDVVYTRVGSPVVTRTMQANRAVFGGEENGGMIIPSFQLARDGAMSLALVLELLASKSRSLEEWVGELPQYSLVKEKIKGPAECWPEVIRAYRAQAPANARVVDIDGVKVYGNGGWVLVRPSGTEPILRVFAEARDSETARKLATDAAKWIEAFLSASPPKS